MYVVNAEVCDRKGKAGVLAPGSFGDVVIASANPLEDIHALARPQETIASVLKAGNPVH